MDGEGPAGPGWEVPRSELAPEAGTFADACRERPDHLVYFLLNVGDGDTQLLLLPADAEGRRRALVVDVATISKLPPLCQALSQEALLPGSDQTRVFPVVVGTHPHEDHIGGMPEFLERHGHQVDEYWEPGYYHPSSGYVETMLLLEDLAHVQRTQPTSGTTRFIGNVKITVLAPGVGLRGRFDSYGIMVNDASIALKVEFPAARVSAAREGGRRRRKRTYHRVREPWSLILGADAQTTSWAQASVDFPQLHAEANPVLYQELRAARGADPLRAQVFKVSHHASKHGVNLELVERMAPLMALVSSTNGGGRYRFPHHLAVEAVREGLQPSTTKQPERPKDHEMGIHYTCAHLRASRGRPEQPLGSMAVLFPPRRGSALQLWRFFDEPGEPVELDRARMLKRVRRPA